MTMMFVRHTVNDFDNWKRVYDDLASLRKENGVTGASVYRDPGDPKTLIITHQFKDLKAAQAFANSEELKSGMAKAGVTGHPEFWFGENLEHTAF